MSFFLKGAPLSNSLIPMIRNLGEEYGMANHLEIMSPYGSLLFCH